MITKEKILNDYRLIKSKANYYYRKGNIEKTLNCIESGAFLAYHFNLFYVDDDYEDVLSEIAEGFKSASLKKINNRYVFYDYFGLDNRGLTQQYIRALISWGVDFMYILIDNGDVSKSSDILKELKEYSKCTIRIVRTLKINSVEVIAEIVSIIRLYESSRLFFHTSPWDVIGCVVLNVFTEIEKYLINLTDHAFWLGKKSCNYFIEFRNYGYNISANYRCIPKEKLLIQPYYPVYTKCDFEGFPVSCKNKIILFTGGAFYKMYGRESKFLNLIKRVLVENNNAIFLVAGGGREEPFETFVKDNKLKERVFFLGNRKDIFEVFKNIDIYIGTYPISGGLMTQFAALNMKNIVSYTSKGLLCNVLDEVLDVDNPIKNRITFTEEECFHKEINRLIRDEEYREKKSLSLYKSIISPSEFSSQLKQLIDNKVNVNHIPVEYPIDTEEFASVYLEAENSFLKHYDSYIYRFLRITKDIFIPLSMWEHVFLHIFKRLKEKIRL